MIPRRELLAISREKGVRLTTVERDYAQNWLLKHLSLLNLVLKGGTGIRKVYIEDYRFSDDLDFTMTESINKQKLLDDIKRASRNAREETGIIFEEPQLIKETKTGFTVKCHSQIPGGSRIKNKLDITPPRERNHSITNKGTRVNSFLF